ncbi:MULTISPECIES: DUF1330 domain-containing protein [unclassified Sphingobium]|uniref:DUF1330 domain-containing protein n=1 Tax=unclassified Sphingobium TaxID=2611147 RepID=UPI00077055D1|nr:MULTISPECIES: DUF1330 domain-containing protein [unclassified Sphingobium]AMK21112.1 hypothetical protein K426_00740 [Sphingobium sp. TKS]NML89698.1 DUF1330 domain-containing protein [Sphingobium sp. TB-6]
MTIYIVSAMDKHDERLYAEYEADAHATFAGHDDIEILAISDHVRAIEGEPPGQRMVLIRAADEAAFDRWYHSPAYQAAKAKRLAASHARFTVMLD